MTTEIKKLTHLDIWEFIQLIRVFEAVFEMKDFKMPAEKHLSGLLEKEDFMVFVAISDKQVAGGLTAYTLRQYYTEFPQVYIYDLAVKTDFQRQGVGKKIMAGIIDFCKGKEMDEIFVQADLEDGHAIDFYRSTGGRAEEVIHFSYPLHHRSYG
jgi:ribosomal protein S18 acetylase RimI-like enzyme